MNGERGFSYKKDAPLDMRMNQEASLTAYEVVNSYDYHDLVMFLQIWKGQIFQQNCAENWAAEAIKRYFSWINRDY